MKSFPEPHELLELFEAEPRLSDVGVPWVYNTLTFVTTRGEDTVSFVLQPSSGQIELEWTRAGLPRVQLAVMDVEAIRVVLEPTVEKLVASFRKKTRLGELVLQLKPHVRLEWGNFR